MRKNILTMMASKTKEDPLDYLCFTAVESNSTVQLNKVGEPYDISLEISRDKKTWTAYNWTPTGETDHQSVCYNGDTITLTNVGDELYWRECTSETNPNKGRFSNYISDEGGPYTKNLYQFALTGEVILSGDIKSLIDAKLEETEIPDEAFKRLFYACSSLKGSYALNASYAGTRSCAYLFSYTSIEEVKVNISAGRAACMYNLLSSSNVASGYLHHFINSTSGQSSMFSYCSNCTIIEVEESITWPTATNSTYVWVNKISPTGTFICPAALPTKDITRGYSTIPEGWTIKKKGYYSNSKFYNDSELTTESVLIEGEYYIDIPTQDEYYYNGTDLILWGGQLPDGYEPLDYIETDGNQYINTGYVGVSPNIEINTKVKVLGAINTEQGIISNFGGGSQYERISLGFIQSVWFLYSRSYANPADDRADISVGQAPQEAIIRVVFDSVTETKQLTVNSVTQVQPYTCKSASSVTYKLMSRGDSSPTNGIKYGFIGRLYYLVLKEDGEVKMHFLPCHDTANNVDGAYDLKRKAFYPLITVTT